MMQTVQKPTPPKRRTPRGEARKMLSTRGGTTLLAVISAILAAGVLLIFLNQYRESVGAADDVSTVLVAKNLIEKGSPGDVVAEDALFQTTQVKKDDLKDGAISDPSSLKGKIATTDIFPGEQLVAGEFAGATPSIINRLRGFDRAIAVPLDEAHGMIGNVRAGDHVDVLAGIGLQQGTSENRRATLRSSPVRRSAPGTASSRSRICSRSPSGSAPRRCSRPATRSTTAAGSRASDSRQRDRRARLLGGCGCRRGGAEG